MRKNVIFRTILTVITIIMLIVPAAAQEPRPPHTPTPPAGLTVESTGSGVSLVSKMPDAMGSLPTPPAPDYIVTEVFSRGVPSVSGQMTQYQADEEAVQVALEIYLRKSAHRSGIEMPKITQVKVSEDTAYGVVECPSASRRALVVVPLRRRAGGEWQILSLDTGDICDGSARTGIIWQEYSNDEWGYSIRYPVYWQVQVAFENNSHMPARVVRQRVNFEDPAGALVSIDVWQNKDALELMDWIGKYQRRVLELGGVTIPSNPNAVISGYEAVVISQPASCSSPAILSAYVSSGDRVFRIQYAAFDDGDMLEVFHEMLLSFKSRLIIELSSESNTERGASSWVAPGLLSIAGPLGTCHYADNSEGCCGYPQIWHWQCSEDSSGTHRGNCTYWAAYKRQDILGQFTGSAGQWAEKAEDAGFPVDSTPRVGDIMVSESMGHVAYVTGVSGNTIYVTEMNWCTQCPERSEDYSAAGMRFIHRKSDTCPAPTDGHPRDGETVVASDRRVRFSWTAPSCSGLDYYTFRVADHQDIDNGPWIVDHGVGSGETSVTEQIPSQYDNQTLYWAIWPHNGAGYGARGGPWSFKVNPNQGGGDAVTIYSDPGHSGDQYGWHDPGSYNLPDWLNTRASSIRINSGWSVRVYEGDDQTGGQRCYNDSDDNFDGDTFDNGHPVNDHVRSVAVYNQEQCPAPPAPPNPPAQPFFPADGSSHPADTSFTLNWQPSANATEYYVHLTGGPNVDRYSGWLSSHLWSVGTLQPGNYNWQVKARNQYGESGYSTLWTFTVQQGTPNAPSGLSASAVSQSQINLTWSDNSSNETGFRLYREGVLVATMGAGTTTYQDAGLDCDHGYNYYVVAYNDAGESGHSNTASATTQACPPSTPPAPNPVSPAQNTTFNCGDEITLVWDDLGAGVEYFVETWGANNRTSGWITENSWYLGEQDGTRTWWHVKARYMGETDESGWGSTTWFNVNSCPQYPDLRPYAPPDYQYYVVPSMVQGTHSESTLYIDQPTYFDWHFINDGNAMASGSFYVELWVGNEQILRYPYSDMGTGRIWGFDDWSHTVTAPGWHTVRLVTDPDDTVGESDEGNNEWTHDFYWHTPCNDLNEYNDEYGQATALSYGETASGDICPLDDWDYYTFYGETGDTIVADIDARVLGSDLDSVLRLFDIDGTTVLTTSDDYGGSRDSHIVYDLPHDGYYYLRVREYYVEAGGDYFYNLSLSGAESAPYYRDFEGDTSGWDTDGMWHLVDDNSPYPNAYSGARSWWYGQDATGDYDNGSSNSGSLTSPPIYIPDTGYYLRFNYWYETETHGLDYDRRCVQVSVDNGPYSELHCLSNDGMGWWHGSPAIDLSDFADHIIRVRFYFDTVDELYNNFRGWYIDNFEISNTPPPSCSDGNEPNGTPDEATTIAYGETKSGYICPGGDMDYFAFTGSAGDTIVADVDADVSGSLLDSVLVLLDSDGVTELASNDDAVPGPGSYDSLVGYTLPHDGTYYLNIRDYEHPSRGDSNYYYDLSLSVDNSAPSGTFLTPTSGTYISSTGHISITAEAFDVGSGVRNVTFLWHSGDWSNPDWQVLGEDWDGSDGWAIDWDVGSLPDQTDAALYAWAFDWGGNWVGMECWGLTLDREPPTTEMETYAPYGGASFLDFWLVWYGNDATAGVSSYDIQYKNGPAGTWTDLITDTTDTYARLIGQDGHTYYFRSRARDWASNAGEYPATAQISYTVQICPVGMDEWEIDDTVAAANSISTDGTAQTHNFDVTGDRDWVKFDVVKGQRYIIQTWNVGGYADTMLYLYDTDGSTLLAFNDDFDGLGWASQIEWVAPADGTYYAMVTHWDVYAYGCETVYTLSISKGQHNVFLPIVLRNR